MGSEKEYSKRLGTISPDRFQAALERFGLGDFVCAESVSSGGEHNVVMLREGGWRVSGVFDWMTAHVGDGAADLSLCVTMYLNRDVALANGFVQAYLEHKPAPPGFVELQRLYMLSLKLSFWEYWQREKGRLPEDESGALSFERWAGPSVAYWEKYR